MTAQEIKTLSITEKVQIMTALWEDMRDHFEQTPNSPELIQLLNERRAKVERGETKILEWDQVKGAIGRG